MRTNPENIPAIIYEWLKAASFAELEKAQQEEVVRHMNADEFDELHFTHVSLVKTASSTPSANREKIKMLLLEHFDHKQTRQHKLLFLNKPVALWKAAAAVLLLLTGWLLFYLAGKKENSPQLAARTDTVYVIKKIPAEPVKIYDTVYVTKYVQSSKKEDRYKEDASPNGSMNVHDNYEPMHIVSVRELDNASNQPKGNSIKDDTLIKKFGFVRM